MYTEQQIRGLAINFLRQHYKLRPRSGTSGTRVVPRVHYYRGVTIDARLAFQQPDLDWFTATVEATSLATAQEVIYRVNWFRIFAYALLVGIGCGAAFLALSQVQGFNVWQWFSEHGGDRRTAYGALFVGMLLTTCITAVLLSFNRDFRYIYAVDQFKRFYANAQWMAYDAEIFRGLPPRYFAEFQRQSIRYGFGMLEVLPDRKVRDVIEPSHIDQFSGKRQRLPLWVAAVQPPPKLRSFLEAFPRPTNAAPAAAPPAADTAPAEDPLAPAAYLPRRRHPSDYAASIIRARPGRPAFYRRPGRHLKSLRWQIRHAYRGLWPHEIRRRPGYYELKYWYYPALLAALLTLLVFGALQSAYRPYATPGSRFETPDIAGLEPAANPEDSQASPELLPGEYDHDFNAENRPAASEYLDAGTSVVAENRPADVARLRINQAGEMLIEYNCLPLTQLTETYYVLVFGVYPDYATAAGIATELNRDRRLAVTAAAETCLIVGGDNYYVYLDAPLLEESQANFMVREYQRRYGLELEVLVIN